MEKRNIDIAVLSDLHLGTRGCKASELLSYLRSIDPSTLILNGDIIDIWQFKKNYWPESHRKVVNKLAEFIISDIPVYYLTGNHDDFLRALTNFKIGRFEICEDLKLNIHGKKAWIFHGDVFDVTMKNSTYLAKLGSIAYEILIRFNLVINFFSIKFLKKKIPLSKKIKYYVKTFVKHISNFEQIVTDSAISNNFDYVICGHIHNPEIKKFGNENGSVLYLNSGDWIENLSSLEFYDDQWHVYHYESDLSIIPQKFHADKINNHTTDQLSFRLIDFQKFRRHFFHH